MPELWVTFAILLLVGTISYNFTVTFPLFVEQGLHGGDAAYTVVYALFSAGAFVGALIVARRRTITLWTIIVGTSSLGVAMLALGAAPNLALAYVLVIPVGVTSVAFMTATTALAQVRSDPRMLGRVIALQTVLLIGTTPVGGPVLGAVSDVAGARAPLLIGGAAAIAAGALGVVARRRSGSGSTPRARQSPDP